MVFKITLAQVKHASFLAVALTLTLIWACPLFAQPGIIEEIQVSIDYIPDEKLATSEVSDLLDADTMSIAGDSDLGGALKRLPGLSLVEGRFIYVRGLGERYSSTYFNGTPMPSPEPLQRAVPLDMFDTAITRNVLVQKTHSSNFGIEFSGGAVDIRSASIPDENFFRIKISTGYNDISTGKPGLSSEGGSRDWLGRDDGGRELPGLVEQNLGLYPNVFGADLNSPEEDAVRLSFTNNDWDIRHSSNPYDYGLSFGGGRRFDVNSRISSGFIVVGSLDNKWRNRLTERTAYTIAANTNDTLGALNNLPYLTQNIDQVRSDAIYNRRELFPNTIGYESVHGTTLPGEDFGILEVRDIERTQRTIRSNLLATFGLEIDQIHSLNFTNLLVRKTTDTVSLERNATYDSPEFEQETRIEWIENEMLVHQLSAEHLFEAATVNWRAALIESSRDTPDSKQWDYRYFANTDSYRLGNNFASQTNIVRSYTYLEDQTEDYGIDIAVPLYRDGDLFRETTIKFGASMTTTERDFASYRFAYAEDGLDDSELEIPLSILLDSSNCVVGAASVTGDNCYLATNYDGVPVPIGPNNAIAIRSGFNIARPDAYMGTAEYEAYYLMFDVQATDSLRLNLGVRNEKSLLEVRDLEGELLGVLDTGTERFEPRRDEDYQLTAVSLTWDFLPNMVLRAAHSETVNRPILRELAAVQFFNPEDGRRYVGNVKLQTAQIENFDLRYELYFGVDDYLSVTAFKKRINNPIEIVEIDLGETTAFSWENSAFAENEGYEMEVRKYLSDFLYVTANATFMDSKVEEAEGSVQLADLGERTLTGVSRELYNAQLIFEDESWKSALSYNRYSRRLYAIGDVPTDTHSGTYLVYEEPFASLDFSIKHTLYLGDSEFTVGLKVSNLLDEKIERTIRNLGNLPYETYEIGQTYGLSLELKQF